MRRLAIGLILPLVILALLAPARPAAAQEEPPARVGRISFIEGELAFHTRGEKQWSRAAVNYPVATGGSFWTDPKGKAEIRVGTQTINLAGSTEVDIVKLDEQVMQVAVPQGRIELHLRNLPQGNTVAIDIPRGGVWLLEPGIYDVDAGSREEPSRVAVFEGSARFVGGPIDLAIKAGDAAVISGWETLAATVEHSAPDAFAEWCRSRDYREHGLAAPYYVSPAMTGYEQLDQYGAWQNTADYGEVWYPNAVAADWVPYRDGHWTWIAPWGWTWVDAAPWGFAPFHYGRWALIDGHWGWVPGRFVPQPVYAPALVAFVGDPGGFALAEAGGPAVGWFPLGPGEVYWPSYTSSQRYIRNVNIANVGDSRLANVTAGTRGRSLAAPPPQVASQGFANRAAATVVAARTFGSAAAVAPAALHVPPQRLQQARVSVRPPPQMSPPAAARIAPPGAGGAPPQGAAGAHPPGMSSAIAPTATPGTPQRGGPGVASRGMQPGTPTGMPPGRPPGMPTAAAPITAPGGRPGQTLNGHPPSAAGGVPPAALSVTPQPPHPTGPAQVMHGPPPQHLGPMPQMPHQSAAPPAQVMQAPPQPHPPAPPQPPHAAPAPPVQVMHAPPQAMPPPQMPRPAAPAPQIMQAPPQAVHMPMPQQQPHPAAPPQNQPAAAQQPRPPQPAGGQPPHGGPPGQQEKKKE